MKRQVRYFVIIEDGEKMTIEEAAGYSQALAYRKRIKAENPGIICRIEMR